MDWLQDLPLELERNVAFSDYLLPPSQKSSKLTGLKAEKGDFQGEDANQILATPAAGKKDTDPKPSQPPHWMVRFLGEGPENAKADTALSAKQKQSHSFPSVSLQGSPGSPSEALFPLTVSLFLTYIYKNM